MSTSTINELTPARYRGLPVTVIGFAGQDLLAIAASGTPQAIAVAVLRPTTDGYRVGTGTTTKPSLAAAAIEAAHLREQRDRAWARPSKTLGDGATLPDPARGRGDQDLNIEG